ncbi:hypothetical protein BROUX41_000466 [Berkeleyomyces rouxiae]
MTKEDYAMIYKMTITPTQRADEDYNTASYRISQPFAEIARLRCDINDQAIAISSHRERSRSRSHSRHRPRPRPETQSGSSLRSLNEELQRIEERLKEQAVANNATQHALADFKKRLKALKSSQDLSFESPHPKSRSTRCHLDIRYVEQDVREARLNTPFNIHPSHSRSRSRTSSRYLVDSRPSSPSPSSSKPTNNYTDTIDHVYDDSYASATEESAYHGSYGFANRKGSPKPASRPPHNVHFLGQDSRPKAAYKEGWGQISK